MFSPSKMFFKIFFAHENMRKPASKVAEPAKIQPKFQFLFHKNLPPLDFSLMTLVTSHSELKTGFIREKKIDNKNRIKKNFFPPDGWHSNDLMHKSMIMQKLDVF